jgi:hypothetical protein
MMEPHLLATDLEVLLSRSRQGLVDHAILISPQRFTKTYVEGLAREFVDKNQKKQLARLLVFTSRQDAGETLWGQPTEMNYEGWLEVYHERGKDLAAMAETLVLNNSAILRIRRRGGKVERAVLKGEDPLELEAQGQKFEILYVHISEIPPKAFVNAKGLRIDIFMRMPGTATVQAAEEIRRQLKRQFPVKWVDFFMRTDRVFVDGFLPYFCPFETDLVPPSPEKYYRSPEILCFTYPTGEQPCDQTRPYKPKEAKP